MASPLPEWLYTYTSKEQTQVETCLATTDFRLVGHYCPGLGANMSVSYRACSFLAARLEMPDKCIGCKIKSSSNGGGIENLATRWITWTELLRNSPRETQIRGCDHCGALAISICARLGPPHTIPYSISGETAARLLLLLDSNHAQPHRPPFRSGSFDRASPLLSS